MKLSAWAISLIFAMMSVNPALARSRHGHGYGHGHGHHSYNHYRGHGHHYGHRSYGHRSYGHYGFHGNHVAYALGGLVVGGILGATLSNSHYNAPRDRGYRERTYSNPYAVTNNIQPSYIRQPNGGCYVVSHVNNGNIVLSPASPGNCQ